MDNAYSRLMGKKLEIYVTELYKDRSSMYPNIRWVKADVNHYRGKDHRQVDVEYFNALSPRPFVILECKYTSSGSLPLRLREEKHKGRQKVKSIDDVLEELEDRRRFVGADKAILVTNGYFAKSLVQKARKYGSIELYDKKVLTALDNERRGVLSKALGLFGLKRAESIDEQIRKVNARHYKSKPHKVRIRII